ncbi:hypothetical protein FH5T_10955 [Draconibacterium orientale]|uniref:Uncharacterized protein n=1 Tax=Draconibacterium orientale TaxID=1168034 RepID=A0ABM5QE50_9BACT|nr:hypothetical protein FH5T_10955 [Draconibacterium orientale]
MFAKVAGKMKRKVLSMFWHTLFKIKKLLLMKIAGVLVNGRLFCLKDTIKKTTFLSFVKNRYTCGIVLKKITNN